MDNTTKSVFEAIADLSRLSTELVVLNAIWLEKPLQIAQKRSIRITKGDMVRVMAAYGDECHLMDCTPLLPPTHVITQCRGTIYSTLLEVECRDLNTNELITIKL